MLIIGITGTLGAGKGTIVDYLVRKKNFIHLSVRDFLLKIIRERGLEENRDNMVVVANELRKKYGAGYIVEQLYKEAVFMNKNVVIESIRNTGEIRTLKKKGNFVLISIDGAQDIRYKRIRDRQSQTDFISYEEFISNEKREMQNTALHAQNIQKCMKQAHYHIINNGSFEELYSQIEKILMKITVKNNENTQKTLLG